MMTLLIPVQTAINSQFTTSAPEFPVHATGQHPPEVGSAGCTFLAGGHPFSSAHQPAIYGLPVALHPVTKCVKCFVITCCPLYLVVATCTCGTTSVSVHTYIHTHMLQPDC